MANRKKQDIGPEVLDQLIRTLADAGEDMTDEEKEAFASKSASQPARKKKIVSKPKAPADKETYPAVKKSPSVKKDPIKTVPEIIVMIRDALESQGSYTPELDLAINAAAGAYRSYLVAQNDMSKLKKTFYLTYTREGNKKYEPHPVIKILKDTHEMTLISLKALGLTLETLTAVANDPLSELVSQVNKIK